MEKISYFKGLLAGYELHPDSRDGKIFAALCDALEEVAEYTKELEQRVAELEELCDILDEDLGALEEAVEEGEFACGGCPSPESGLTFQFSGKEKKAEEEIEKPETETESAEEVSPDEVSIDVSEKQLTTSINKADIAAETDGKEDNFDEFDEDEEYETICPTCGMAIILTEQMLEEGETVCPNCGEELEFDFDEEEIENLSPAEE